MFQLEPTDGKNRCLSLKMVSQRKSHLLGQKFSLFVPFRSSPDLMRPTTLGRAICFTPSTSSNTVLIQKCSHRRTQNNVGPKSGHPMGSLVNVTCKISNHNKKVFAKIILCYLVKNQIEGY